MEEEKINLSQKVCEYLGIDSKNISREELREKCKEIMETSRDISKLNMEIEKSDIEEISKYIDSRDVNVIVDGKPYKFTQDLIENMENLKTKHEFLKSIKELPINYEEFKRCKEHLDIKEVDFVLKISLEDLEEFSEFNEFEIQELQEQYKVKRIELIGTEEQTLTQSQISILKYINKNIDINVVEKIKISKQEYINSKIDLKEYLQVEEEYNKLLDGIDVNASEFEKFSEIYKRIAEKIEYDHDIIEGTQEYIDENTVLSRNSVNGMLKGKCVCAGYSTILYRALSKVGIDCKYITGKTDSLRDSEHAWNQVKIDGKWYNTDLTWDREDLVNGNEPDFCLKSDEEFIMHEAKSEEIEKCEESYDIEEIKKQFEEKGFNIEQKQYNVDEIFNLLEQLKSESKGIRISVNEDIETGEYKLNLGKLKTEECIKWSENEITLSSEEFSKFVNKYVQEKQNIQKDNIYYKSQDNIQLVIFEDIQQELLERGVDIDAQMTAMVEEKLKQPDKQQGNNQLIEYKPSILSKIKMFFKEKIDVIKQKYIDNKIKKESLKENIIQDNEKKENPSNSFKKELEVDNQTIQDISKVASEYQKNQQSKGENKCTRDSR